MSAPHSRAHAEALGIGAMCGAATWFIDLTVLPRHGEVVQFREAFIRYLGELMSLVEQLTSLHGPDDGHAHAALASVAEARRRLAEPEAAGLNGEVTRVKQLARSVVALSEHHEALTALRADVCPGCDRAIEAGVRPTP
ncbi:DUF6415 family natural product biosynthesis protein [Streptomyces sp. 15-116A]|uniref:DUF6415 family natural product biosynthesis protein n=1 Tax=Streptomyces sp. 15-116A TaxID=2259035 RepID=UPI0021B3FDA9|nr:DUF6415 family natural product biosynthesis protein [Streptomyces sp. 15-116A]MCT7353112.1 DUF6415 family natural product biosynthesis protein [Streptomyces sp. 15-116A]